MEPDNEEVIEVSAGRIRSWATQLADLRVMADQLVAAVRGTAAEKDATRLRDGFGALGVQWMAVVRRHGEPDAEVRELRPRGEDKR